MERECTFCGYKYFTSYKEKQGCGRCSEMEKNYPKIKEYLEAVLSKHVYEYKHDRYDYTY